MNQFTAIDEYVADQMRHLSIPGVALAIVEGDGLAHFRGFGLARPHGEAPTLQTPFFIGSVTKSFTALAIMQLVEAGKVELDAPVQRCLPWFRVADRQATARITVRHLLNQTSGLPMSLGLANLSDLDNRPDGLARQVKSFSTAGLSHPVGTKFEYSNANYNVLGLIVEQATGQTYADYIQAHIFDQLEMRHSFVSKEAARMAGLAVGHRYWFGHPIPEPNLTVPLSSLPSGQLISCAEDMAHYLSMYINGGRYGDVQVLSAAGIEEMLHGVANMDVMGQSIGFYGFGWSSKQYRHARIVSHGGIVPDFGAFIAVVPEQKKGLALLYNANSALYKMTFDEFGMGAVERLAGETPSKTVFGSAPWVSRGLALIPLLQAVESAATIRQIRRWQADPASRPSRGRLWGRHILPGLIPNLLAALLAVPLLGKMRGFLLLFAPDYAWVARISGGVAVIWAVLKTGLLLRSARKS